MPDREKPDLYVVLSLEHDGRWWGPGGNGYVRELSKAGRFTREGALRICAHAIPGNFESLSELLVREVDAEAMRDMHFAEYTFGPKALA
jgi:hypothetical protein